MKSIARNIFAVILGWIIGSAMNMGLIIAGPMIIAPPELYDPTNMNTMKETFHHLGPIDFVFPFLAHALGTLVGALTAYLIAGSRKMVFALVIGGVFLLGGIMMVVMIKTPLWFSALDLIVAYLPMAWLGGNLGQKIQG